MSAEAAVLCQVKSRFVLEADVKAISRQITSIVMQVKRDRELKQFTDTSTAVSVTQSATSLTAAAAAGSTQPPAASTAASTVVTSPAPVPSAQTTTAEVTSSSVTQVNGVAVSSVAPVAATVAMPSVVTAGPTLTPTVNTVTASVNATTLPHASVPAKPPPCMSTLLCDMLCVR